RSLLARGDLAVEARHEGIGDHEIVARVRSDRAALCFHHELGSARRPVDDNQRETPHFRGGDPPVIDGCLFVRHEASLLYPRPEKVGASRAYTAAPCARASFCWEFSHSLPAPEASIRAPTR